MTSHPYRDLFEDLYARYNRRAYVEPDPLQFLYAWPDVRDREIVGLLAATLALGRVAAINRSVAAVLRVLGPRPAVLLAETTADALAASLAGFRHRFFTGDDVAGLLAAAGAVARRHGSLEACFRAGLRTDAETVVPAVEAFVRALEAAGCGRACRNFLPRPERGSACKRLHLYLRWMVRRDAVDPGGWSGVPASRLVVPLDTHLFALGRELGMIGRAAPNLAAALEMTAALRRLSPEDPVRYDFALTRLGIRPDMDREGFVRRCAAARVAAAR